MRQRGIIVITIPYSFRTVLTELGINDFLVIGNSLIMK